MPGKIYKRGNIYWIGFSYRGTVYRRSAQTEKRREAEKLLSFYLGQCAQEQFRGFEQEKGITLDEALVDFVADYRQRGLRDIEITTYRTGNLRAFFKDIPAADITERKIDLYIKHRLNMGRSRTTVNRELQLLGQALRLAKRKKLIKEVPHIEKFSEKDNARQGFFEREEFEKIVGFLPDYLKDLTRFAYHTGWRKGEILTLEWRDIQGDIIRLRPEIAKNKDGRIIILVGEVAKIIDRRQAESVEFCPYVFHRQGKQVRDYSRAWGKARKLAGVPHRLFHDARRTAARNMDRARVPRSVAKQIIGHKTDAMYNRYRIVDEQDIREGMTQSENYLANTNGAHLGHSWL